MKVAPARLWEGYFDKFLLGVAVALLFGGG